jgi:hypothetical protein
MNKKGFWKVLMVTLVMVSAIGLLASGAIAQTIDSQILLQDELGQQVGTGATILLDNFQYWNSPRDMGWEAFEPAYPTFGAGIGLGIMETVVDFQEGSRVMEVHSTPSTFLPMGGDIYNPYTITKDANFRSLNNVEFTGIPGAFSQMDVQVKAPLSVEWFDTFRIIVRVRVTDITSAGGALNNAVGMIDTSVPLDGIPDEEVPLGADDVCGTNVNTVAGNTLGLLDIVFVPRETSVGCTPDNVAARTYEVKNAVTAQGAQITYSGSILNSSQENIAYAANGQLTGGNPASAWVALGRQFQDGSWHLVSEDLQQVVDGISTVGEQIFEIVSVTVRGNQYRMDDLMFTAPGASVANNSAPYLFRIGPVYGQLFNVAQSRFIFAEDEDMLYLLSDRALLAKAQQDDDFADRLANINPRTRLRLRLAAAQNSTTVDFPFIEDANGLTPAQAGFNPLTATFVDASQSGYWVDATGLTPADAGYNAATAVLVNYIPVQDATGLRPTPGASGEPVPPAGYNAATATPVAPGRYTVTPAGGATPTPRPTVLNYTFTMGDSLGSLTSVASGRTLDVNGDGAVTAADAAAITTNYLATLPSVIPAMNVPTSAWIVNTGTLVGNPMYVMACALINSGVYTQWPNFQILQGAQGQVLEDMIVTCRVSDGLATDMETFPISVVNYPVTNVPPLIEQLEDQFFQVGTQSFYQITATDPDPQDMAGGLTYQATLNGLSSYQYGPWMNQIINPITGLITLTPQFDATMTCIVTVTDPRGAQAVGHFNIFCVNPGTWLNHAPAVLEVIESPQVCRAGQRFTISDLRIADPDGESLYYSCNVGSVGANGIWTFQSEYPGEYLVQITAYDIVGGAVTQQFVLQVMPWWSI